MITKSLILIKYVPNHKDELDFSNAAYEDL